ncbi:MAG: chorismate mutase [Gammaproteobacteria bacterium]|nr:chorismate mutase [Gammaproteobacteria bacterium]
MDKQKSPKFVVGSNLHLLLKKRFLCAELIGISKSALRLPIHEPRLEKSILETVKKHAVRHHLDEALILSIFSKIFEKSRYIQSRVGKGDCRVCRVDFAPVASGPPIIGPPISIKLRNLLKKLAFPFDKTDTIYPISQKVARHYLSFARTTIRVIDREIIKTIAENV